MTIGLLSYGFSAATRMPLNAKRALFGAASRILQRDLAHTHTSVKKAHLLSGGFLSRIIGKSCRIVKKQLYLFAGFDDYPIANHNTRRKRVLRLPIDKATQVSGAKFPPELCGRPAAQAAYPDRP